MRDGSRVIMLVLCAAGAAVWIGCGDDGAEADQTDVSGALRTTDDRPRLGQAFELVAAGRDGEVSLFKGEVVGLEPVYQHNQTDLEFLLVRAARPATEAEASPAPPPDCLPSRVIPLLGFPLRPAATVVQPALRLAGSVEIAGAGERFDGKYLVAGVSHRFVIARADGAQFALPEIDDEVLVAFVVGDLRRPVILGSLWNSDDRPPAP